MLDRDECVFNQLRGEQILRPSGRSLAREDSLEREELAVYDGFGVPEVWLYERGASAVNIRRKGGGYELARAPAAAYAFPRGSLSTRRLIGPLSKAA